MASTTGLRTAGKARGRRPLGHIWLAALLACLAIGLIGASSALADGMRFPIGDGWGIPTTTQGFGVGGGHLGEDYGYGMGTPVKAAYKGVVVYSYFGGASAYNGGWGNSVIVKHTSPTLPGGVLYTQYDHLSSVAVSTGQSVATGQVIGGVGTSGKSTGPHLHFEVKSGSALGKGYSGVNFGGNSYAYGDGGGTRYRANWFVQSYRTLADVAPAPAPAPQWIASAVVVGNAPGSTPLGSQGWTPVVFTVKTGPWTVNVRSATSTTAAIVRTLPANTSVTCYGWQHGQSVSDAWYGTADARWYRVN